MVVVVKQSDVCVRVAKEGCSWEWRGHVDWLPPRSL